jgi:hypothetical protein
MPPAKPEPGLVIRYSYLWLNEFLAGQEEGVKDRPCAIIAAIRNEADGTQRVLVLPVTHVPPTQPEYAIEIPHAVKRHLKLDDERSWIVVSESNEFTWPGPDLRPTREGDGSTIAYGFLPPNFFLQVRKLFLSLPGAQQTRTIPRTE